MRLRVRDRRRVLTVHLQARAEKRVRAEVQDHKIWLRPRPKQFDRGPAAGVRLRVLDRRRVFIVNPQARRIQRQKAQILHVRVPLPYERREAP